jgi:hypothetical protein
LTKAENARNTHGPHLLYTYFMHSNDNNDAQMQQVTGNLYKAPSAAFPDVLNDKSMFVCVFVNI